MSLEKRIDLQRQHSEVCQKVTTAVYYADHGFGFGSLSKLETAKVFTLQTDEADCPANIMKDAARRVEAYYLRQAKAIGAALEKSRQSND